MIPMTSAHGLTEQAAGSSHSCNAQVFPYWSLTTGQPSRPGKYFLYCPSPHQETDRHGEIFLGLW